MVSHDVHGLVYLEFQMENEYTTTKVCAIGHCDMAGTATYWYY